VVYVTLSQDTKKTQFLFCDFRENTLKKKLKVACMLCIVTIMWQDIRVSKGLKMYFRKAKLNTNVPFCHFT